MNQSNEVKELYTALAGAQAKFENIINSEKARVPTKAGGSFEYTYASLASYLEQIRPTLAEFKLFVMQGVEIKRIDNVWMLDLETRLGHESGQWITSNSYFPVPPDPQQAGSVITYMRRYTLAGFLGLATEDDDGAAGKAGAQRPTTGTWPAPQKATPSTGGAVLHGNGVHRRRAIGSRRSPKTLMQVDPQLMASMPEDTEKVWQIIGGLPPEKQAKALAMKQSGVTDTVIWSKIMSK